MGFFFVKSFHFKGSLGYLWIRVSSYRSRYFFMCSWEKKNTSFLWQSSSYCRNFYMSLIWTTYRMINTFVWEHKLPLDNDILKAAGLGCCLVTAPKGTMKPDSQHLWGQKSQENVGVMDSLGWRLESGVHEGEPWEMQRGMGAEGVPPDWTNRQGMFPFLIFPRNCYKSREDFIKMVSTIPILVSQSVENNNVCKRGHFQRTEAQQQLQFFPGCF